MMPERGASVALKALTKLLIPNSLIKLVQKPPMMKAKTDVIRPAVRKLIVDGDRLAIPLTAGIKLATRLRRLHIKDDSARCSFVRRTRAFVAEEPKSSSTYSATGERARLCFPFFYITCSLCQYAVRRCYGYLALSTKLYFSAERAFLNWGWVVLMALEQCQAQRMRTFG